MKIEKRIKIKREDLNTEKKITEFLEMQVLAIAKVQLEMEPQLVWQFQ
ncbi:MAG: hypothetical protein UR60_C0043G0010 [Candidatus Moranbacteria bacterium GW2011_GWF2_34_56]|nr:MAG: hypothetical protein UR51_C0002G0044 [Candidatus Moranbacteria bacterium GW2011_GWF1_34_10]KKP63500.1 MAG: hypothetical protein UR60_C0043G0010 [Candidatus Moranbacteria bacterium GW2011_GWF2_34_56]